MHKSRTPDEYLAYVKARDLRRAERYKRERKQQDEKKSLAREFDRWLRALVPE